MMPASFLYSSCNPELSDNVAKVLTTVATIEPLEEDANEELLSELLSAIEMLEDDVSEE